MRGGGRRGGHSYGVPEAPRLSAHEAPVRDLGGPRPSPACLAAHDGRRGGRARQVALTPASVAQLRRVGAWTSASSAARARPFTAMAAWDARARRARCGTTRASSAPTSQGTSWRTESVMARSPRRRAEPVRRRRAERRGGGRRRRRLRRSAARPDPPAGRALRGAETPIDGTKTKTERKTTTEKVEKQPLSTETTQSTRSTALRARLVIGADGAHSPTRRLSGTRAYGWSYGQKAAVGTVRLSRASDVAWQRFLPDGPIAVLPATDDPCVANVVWTNAPAEADRIAALDDDAFAREVDAAFRGIGKYAFSGDSESRAKAFDSESPGSRGSPESPLERLERLVVSGVLEPLTKSGMTFSEKTHRNGAFVATMVQAVARSRRRSRCASTCSARSRWRRESRGDTCPSAWR